VSRQLASPPVVGGDPELHSGRANKPVHRVVVHSAVIACEPGRARQLARMNQLGSTGGSWHYATDPAETIQCSWDSWVCWHAPPNLHSLGIEMADWPGPRPTGLTRRALWNLRRTWRWRGANHRAMLDRTARLTAELCVLHDLPPAFLTVRQLRAGRRGVTTHNNVSRAWHQSTHWDPGWWPRRRFMRKVRREVQRIRDNRK
jgi:N-acetylmuramoyl-L-alanine amidase